MRFADSVFTTSNQVLVNWAVGVFMIALGGYHSFVGGPELGQALRALRPALPPEKMLEGRLGFELGGYLAIAVGLSFIVIGRKLPSQYYLFWAAINLAIGAISLFWFAAFHVSQLIWLTTLLLFAYYRSSVSIESGFRG